MSRCSICFLIIFQVAALASSSLRLTDSMALIYRSRLCCLCVWRLHFVCILSFTFLLKWFLLLLLLLLPLLPLLLHLSNLINCDFIYLIYCNCAFLVAFCILHAALTHLSGLHYKLSATKLLYTHIYRCILCLWMCIRGLIRMNLLLFVVVIAVIVIAIVATSHKKSLTKLCGMVLSYTQSLQWEISV